MKELIEVFRMTEISPDTRAKLIIKIGTAINHQYASNITEPIVFELVTMLDPQNEILKDKNFLRLAWRTITG